MPRGWEQTRSWPLFAEGRRDVDVEEVEGEPGLAPRALRQRAGAVCSLAGEGRALVAARRVDDEVQGLGLRAGRAAGQGRVAEAVDGADGLAGAAGDGAVELGLGH